MNPTIIPTVLCSGVVIIAVMVFLFTMCRSATVGDQKMIESLRRHKVKP